MERTRPAGVTLSWDKRAAHTANADKTKLHALNVKRALKGVQLQPSAPESEERQARLREDQSLDLVHWRKMIQAVVTLVRSREQETEMGIGFCGVLEQQEGSNRQRVRYLLERRD